ncbi:LPS translocon maturation chaperone LptM [Vibrio anguillarum]
MKKSIAALFMLSLLALAGCGQTGSLYMPAEPEQSEQPQP